MAVVAVRRAEYAFGVARLVTVEVSDGAVEIYRVDPADGLEMFQGYLSNPRLPAVWRVGAVEALCRAPYFESWANRWGRRPPGQIHR